MNRDSCPPSILAVDNLSVSVPIPGREPVSVVRSVSLEVSAGRTLGIVGESGCGKSMTLLSLVRLLPAGAQLAAGSSVRLNGRELTRLSRRELEDVRGNEIGFVFQDPMSALNPVYKVSYQVGQVIRRHRGLGRSAARTQALETLRSVGFPDPRQVSSSYPHQLSGGMRQRVVIAMALAAEPSVLLADEPTTALDVTTQAEVLELLMGLRAERNMALVIVSHDLGLIGEVADEVCVMYAGRIVEHGPAAELLNRPRHPYSQGLLQAAASLETAGGGPLTVIPGGPPAVGEQIQGCAFRPRCSFAFDDCAEQPPLLESGSVSAACWLLKPRKDPMNRGQKVTV